MKPFAGMKVLDLTTILAGPMVGAFLGDMGADVVKIERGEGDSIRVNKQTELIYIEFNRSKRGISLDYKTPEGLDALLRMADQADILVENSRPGVAERRGYGFDVLHERNPRLIYCAISAYGRTGPYAQRPANDWIIQGVSGLMSWTGEAGGEPLRIGPALADYAGGMDAIAGVVTALYMRESTGVGQRVDVSLLDSSLYMVGQRLMHYPYYGEPLRPAGNRHPWGSPAEAYRTKDGTIHVVCQDAWRWPKFCAAIGRPDMVTDLRFKDNRGRLDNRDEMNAILDPIFAQRTSQEWIELLADQDDQMVGIQQDLAAVLEDPQVQHNEILRTMPYPGYPDLPLVNTPIRLSEAESGITRRAPLLGEHTEEVLAEYGFSAEEIHALAGA